MLLNEQVRDVQHSGVGEVVTATIKATAKVFSFFSDMTYTNKIEAVVRELVSNGIDSNKMAGNNDPITVTLPTEADPTFRVKDQGLGMSHEFLTTSFMAYTDGTTKSGSNIAIGGFGIGSKSPFAYTDQFTIRSVHEGRVGTYSIFKNDEGVPCCLPLDLSDTDEPNSVEVMVAVEPADFERFTETAQTILTYFDPIPNLIGADIIPADYIARGEGWAVRKTSGDLAIIMGGVRYVVARTSLPYDVRSNPLVSYGIDLTLPIGSCSVAISREALSLDDNTVTAIITALSNTKDAIVASFATIFDQYESKWEAMKALEEQTGGNMNRGRLLADNAKWKGEPLAQILRPDLDVWTCVKSNRRTSISRKEFVWRGGIRVGTVSHLIIDDLPDSPKSRLVSRVKESYQRHLDYRTNIVIVRGKDALEQLGNPPRSSYKLASELPLPITEPRVAGTSQTRSCKLFRLSSGYYHLTGSGAYQEITTLDKRNVYVVMHNYEPEVTTQQQLRHGLVESSELVFVNKSDASKVRDLRPFADVYAERFAAFSKADNREVAYYKALAQDEHVDELFKALKHFETLPELTPAQAKRPFGRVMSLYTRYFYNKSDISPKTVLVDAKYPPYTDTKKLMEDFHKDQWQAATVLDGMNMWRPEARKLLLELV